MKKAGFSLIEILIATSILLVIVVMVSMVFQQQSAAFQSGETRVKGQAAVRNSIGMVMRDLALAVDSADYSGLPANSFSGSSLKFLATTGEAGVAPDGTSVDGIVSLQSINYTVSGGIVKRNVKGIKTDGDRLSVYDDHDSDSELNSSVNRLKSMKFSKSSGGSATFPDFVTIVAEYEGADSAFSVRGQSAGKDGRWNTKDDIYVGGKP